MKNEIISTALQIVTLLMLCRSAFQLLRVRNEIKRSTIIISEGVLLVGIFLTCLNLADPEYYMQRFPWNTFWNVGAAYAFFEITKIRKESLFNISNIIKRQWSSMEKSVMNRITDDGQIGEVEIIDSNQLQALKIGVPYPKDTYILTRNTPPMGRGFDFKFGVEMLAGASFAEQYHPDMYEEIYVDAGEVYDKSTGTIYKAGHVIKIPAGKKHHIIALTKSSISAYLTIVQYQKQAS